MVIQIIKDLTRDDDLYTTLLIKKENTFYLYRNDKEKILQKTRFNSLKELEGRKISENELPDFQTSIYLILKKCYDVLTKDLSTNNVDRDKFIIDENYQLAFYGYRCYYDFIRNTCLR